MVKNAPYKGPPKRHTPNSATSILKAPDKQLPTGRVMMEGQGFTIFHIHRKKPLDTLVKRIRVEKIFIIGLPVDLECP